MIVKAQPISKAALVVFVYLLITDLVLWSCMWLVLLWSNGDFSLDLPSLWAFRTISCVVLLSTTSLVADSGVQHLLNPWVVLLSILPPVYDTTLSFLPLGYQKGFSPVPDPGMVILSSVTSTVIYLGWETEFFRKSSAGLGPRNSKKEEAKALLMRVIGYSRPDSLYLGAAFLFLSLAALLETFIPYYIGKVVDVLSGKYLHDNFLQAIGLLALCSLGSSLFTGLRGGMFMCSLCRLNQRIRHMLFHNLLKQEISFFEENKTGSLTSRLASDTDKMGRSVAMNVNVFLRSLVKTCGMLYFMLGLSWQLTVLTCIEMPLVAFLQNSYNNISKEAALALQDCNAETAELASSVIGSVNTVRSFRAEEQEQSRYEKALQRKLHVLTRKGIYSAVHLLIRRFITVGLKVAMLFQGRNLISAGRLSSGTLLAFVFYQKDMVTNMKHLVYIYGEALNSVGSAVKVFQLLDRKSKMREEGDLAPDKLEGKLTFQKVSFSYSSRPHEKALKCVSLELRPGKLTALVGPSGGGKSSCVCLLQRFYEPQEGDIFLDSKPLHLYQHRYLHRKIASVSQDPLLFSGTVRHNIEYGLLDCTFERVEAAARRANAHDFICKLQQGYDTDVGECGGQLSSGQKQCIGIARALIRNPRILILDEATSHMDSTTQHAVQDALNGMKDQTILVIAHRLETVKKADHIIYMEKGEVLEQGTHQQLMAKKGRYHRLSEKLFTLETDL